MSYLTTFFSTMILAMAAENAVFTRALGINRWVEIQDSPKNILWYGGLFGWVSIFATMGNYFVIYLLDGVAYSNYYRAISFVLVVFIVYFVTIIGISYLFPKRREKLLRLLPITTFNTAFFGVFYIMLNRNYTLLQSISYSVGNAFGYTIAIFLLYFARKRLALSPVPRSFRGTPIVLVYIGLFSLALYGLLGYGVAG